MGVRGLEDLLGESLEIVLVEIEGSRFELFVIGEELSLGPRPGLDIQSYEITEFGCTPLFCFKPRQRASRLAGKIVVGRSSNTVQ